jgi:hypothetical protein
VVPFSMATVTTEYCFRTWSALYGGVDRSKSPTARVNTSHLLPSLHTHLQRVRGGSTTITTGSHGYAMVLIVGARRTEATH